MSVPSESIWNCRSGFGTCFMHTMTFGATAGVPERRALFQRSPRTGGLPRTIPEGTYRPRAVAGTMRTLLAFVAVAAVFMTIGTFVAAVILAAPSKDLFL